MIEHIDRKEALHLAFQYISYVPADSVFEVADMILNYVNQENKGNGGTGTTDNTGATDDTSAKDPQQEK